MESGTIEQSLPGIEPTGHSRGGGDDRPRDTPTPQKRLMVFAGRSHPELASKIGEHLGAELGEVELTTFAVNGETYCRYCESIRGADVFIVQTGLPSRRPEHHGAPLLHDSSGQARVGEAQHCRDPVVPVLTAGSQGEAARADLRAACLPT